MAGVAALLGLLLVLRAQRAEAHDGAIRWRTLRGPHVVVHHPARLRPFARRVLAAAEDAWTALLPLFGYRPTVPLDVTVQDYVDATNGFARSIPYDQVLIRAYPPDPSDDLADNGDWIRALVFHEMTHVLHLGDATGLPAVLNAVLGRTYLPNQYLPRFFIEGLATAVETRHVGSDHGVQRSAGPWGVRGGRVEGAPYMGRLRAVSLAGRFPAVSELTGRPLDWPRGRGWYLFGSWLLDHQLRRYGQARLRRFLGAYGGRAVPYGINNLYRRVYGRSALAIWRDAVQELAVRVRREGELRAVGLVPPVSQWGVARAHAARGGGGAAWGLPGPARRLTSDGEGRGRVRWMPGGRHVVLSRVPADDLARIERVRLSDGRATVLHRCELDCGDVLVSPDGRWLIWVASRPNRRLYQLKDVFARRLGGTGRAVGETLRVTRGMRMRDLSIDPGGERLWAVAVVDGLTEIVSLPLQAALRAAARGRPPPKGIVALRSSLHAEVLGSPVAVGDGRLLFTRGRGTRRSLWCARIDAVGRARGAARRLPFFDAAGVAMAAEVTGASPGPATVMWLDDLQVTRRPEGVVLGAVVQLGSFRDAAELPLSVTALVAKGGGRARWRLRSWSPTSVVSAAFDPAGPAAVALQAEHDGLDLYRLAPPARRSVSPPSPGAGGRSGSSPPPAGRLGSPGDAPSPTFAPPSVSVSEIPYSPWRSIRPLAWAPTVEIAAAGALPAAADITLGASLDGQDAVGLYAWNLLARSDLALTHPSLVLSATLQRWEPTWTLAASWSRPDIWARRGFRHLRLRGRALSARLGGTWRVPLARDAVGVEGSLKLTSKAARDDLGLWRRREGLPVPWGPAPLEPDVGAQGEASAGLSWSRVERYPESVVVERRRSFRLFGTWAGQVGQPRWTPLRRDLTLLRLDLHADLAWPLGGHRVLSWRARLGWAPWYPNAAPPFRLVGLPPVDAAALLLGGAGGDFGVVRGVVEAGRAGRLVAGRALAWSSVGLHLPLPAVGRGLDLLPFFLGRTWATVFADGAALLSGEEARLLDARTGGGAVISAGAEVAVDLEVAYTRQGALKVGWARAFGDIGTSQWYIRLGL